MPKGRKRFCTQEHYFESLRNKADSGELYICDGCGEEFRSYPSLRKGKRKYHTAACYWGHREYPTGEAHPLWQGGTYISDGYLIETDHSRRYRNGAYASRGQHLRIAEETLGRPLAAGEHVHHLNGDRLDNRPENLLVLTASQHRALHGFYSQSFQRDHAASGDLLDLTLAFLATLPSK